MVSTYNWILASVFILLLIPFFVGIYQNAQATLKERDKKIAKRRTQKEEKEKLQQEHDVTFIKEL